MYKKNTQAFSLIELLAVMTIILIIAGFFVGVGGPARESAKKRKAEVMISALEVAIGMYKADTGVYPVTDGGTGCTNLYDRLTNTAVWGSGGSTPMTGWGGPYMEFKSEDISGGQIKDPWSRVYRYKTLGDHNTNSFDLWSIGPDNQDDNPNTNPGATAPNDDRTNW
jgi:general secretion pathway protein G